MAIEAIEGTDIVAILRGGGESSAVGMRLSLKTKKPNQDVRFDVPAVSIKQLMSMIDGGCRY